ncbi:MAG: hypothetical protein J5747_07190 [Spirochaetaceae bacterium]|nr:hypothetical protein [Spirochaetaceae bacterium]
MRKIFIFIMLLSVGCLFLGCSNDSIVYVAETPITVELATGYPNLYYTSSGNLHLSTGVKIYSNEPDYTFRVLCGEEGYRSEPIYLGYPDYYNSNQVYSKFFVYYVYNSDIDILQDYAAFLNTCANGSSSLNVFSITKAQWEQADSTAGYAAGHYKELLRELSKYCAPITITCVDFHKDYVITDLGRLGDLLED